MQKLPHTVRPADTYDLTAEEVKADLASRDLMAEQRTRGLGAYQWHVQERSFDMDRANGTFRYGYCNRWNPTGLIRRSGADPANLL